MLPHTWYSLPAASQIKRTLSDQALYLKCLSPAHSSLWLPCCFSPVSTCFCLCCSYLYFIKENHLSTGPNHAATSPQCTDVLYLFVISAAWSLRHARKVESGVPVHDVFLGILRNCLSQIMHWDKCSCLFFMSKYCGCVSCWLDTVCFVVAFLTIVTGN